MALHYNLAKVYALSKDKPEFVQQTINGFVNEIPNDLAQLKKGIETKNYEMVWIFANKIKKPMELLGLKMAFEETLQIIAWTKTQGEKKHIIETYKSIKQQAKNAVKELSKDFQLKIEN